MEFTHQGYRGLLHLLRDKGYAFTDYFSWMDKPRCVILRHDIDFSLDCALRFSELERAEGVASTWFVLLKTDFYNVFTEENRAKLRRLQENGGTIGLHFDESQYTMQLKPLLEQDGAYQARLCALIREEAAVLGNLLQTEIRSVAMHCPAPSLLERDLEIPGMVNTYGKTFFREFKYLSDSRMHWREDVDGIVAGQKYPHLQILTHAFWYQETAVPMKERLRDFCRAACAERYRSLNENFSALDEVLRPEEL